MSHCQPPKVNPPVVIDNGSFTIKAGFAGDQKPRLVIPTVIAHHDGVVYIGDECTGKAELHLEYPIQRGSIVNWDNMTEIWRYVLKTLNADLSKNPILLTEAANVTKADREKMTQIMFEKFNASSVYLANQPILSLYAGGRMEGFVVSSGYGVTQLVPSHQGNLVPTANGRIDIGGHDLTKYIMDTLAKEGTDVTLEIARQIKESYCYVALDKGTTPDDVIYKLPDGKEVVLNTIRIATTEFFLQPSLITAINDAIIKSAQESGMSLESLYSAVVISGGNTLFKGMAERMQKELQALVAPGITVTVVETPSGVNATFIGGSVLTCLPAFPPLCMTKENYEKEGPAVVHTKCQ